MIKINGSIPISIYPFFWLLAAAIGWMNTFSVEGTLIWMAIIVISVLVHEFGHALTAIAFGQKAQIELVGFGGVTQRKGGKTRLWQEFIIVLNGPLAGLLLAGIAYLGWNALHASYSNSLASVILRDTIAINIFWTIINLLPVQPLDGGKLLSIILESMFGLRGAKISLFISLIVSAMFGLFFFSIQAFLAGAIFFLLSFESWRSWKSTLVITEQDQNFILQHMLKDAERAMRNGNQDEALTMLERIRDFAKSGLIYMTATEHTAAILAEKGDFKAAYAMLEPLSSKLSPQALRLLHELAYRQGEWKEAITLGDRAFQFSPNYQVAVINALCHSILGHARPAVGWLQCAIREGVPNLQEILAKREFDAIRGDPSFQQFKNRSA
jgi:stage IV sporulation protein FB